MTTFTISPAIPEAKITPAWIKAERYSYCDQGMATRKDGRRSMNFLPRIMRLSK